MCHRARLPSLTPLAPPKCGLTAHRQTPCCVAAAKHPGDLGRHANVATWTASHCEQADDSLEAEVCGWLCYAVGMVLLHAVACQTSITSEGRGGKTPCC